jgi:DNA-binding winged helix-turn-helix (wHTH) protein/tetratricopeptide (TPR) repeat protein
MPSTYRFGDFELRPAQYRLLRSGEEVTAEPRVLEVLTYLIAHRDRVVSKEELLRELWQGRYVGESALTRCVYEVRSALGEDSQAPRFIKTVHGRGYQFTGDVVEENSEDAVEAKATVAEETSPRRRRGTAVAIAAIVAIVVVTSILLWNARDREPKPGSASPAVHRLAILPISVSEENAELELTSLSLTDLLTMRLAGAPGLVIRSPAVSEAASIAEESLADFAASARVSHVISGTLRPSSVHPGKANLLVNLFAVDGSRVLRTPIGSYDVPYLRREASLEEFTRVREAIVERVLFNLARVMDLPAHSAREPRNAEAFRLYLLANRQLYSLDCGSGGAVQLLQRSLELDERFVGAWTSLGFAEYNQMWACGRGEVFARRALDAADRALKLEPGNPWAIWLRVSVLTDLGRVEEAYELADKAAAAAPLEPAFHHARAYSLMYAGFLAQSREALERTLALDPLFLAEAGDVPFVLIYLGEWDRFLRLIPAAGPPFYRFYQGYAQYRAGRLDAAAEALSPAFRTNPNDVFARLCLALLAVIEGDHRDARNIIGELARQRREVDATDGGITFKQAQILAMAGDLPEATAHLETAVEQGFFCPPCIANDRSFSALHDDARFRALLVRARERQAAFARRFHLAPQQIASGVP